MLCVLTHHTHLQAVKKADVVYTDVWASMGQKEEAQKRRDIFKNFQVSRWMSSGVKEYVTHTQPCEIGMKSTILGSALITYLVYRLLAN